MWELRKQHKQNCESLGVNRELVLKVTLKMADAHD